MDQHFLRNPEKIERLIRAAGVRPGDRVVELGAGIGSVARNVPGCRSLTLVELDPRLVRALRSGFPRARVIQADAVTTLPALEFDVLFTNLPHFLTTPIIDVLGGMRFRVAVMAVRADEDIVAPPQLRVEDVAILNEDDFDPRQPFRSKAIRVRRRARTSGHQPG